MFRDRDAMPVRHMDEGSETARLPLPGPYGLTAGKDKTGNLFSGATVMDIRNSAITNKKPNCVRPAIPPRYECRGFSWRN